MGLFDRFRRRGAPNRAGPPARALADIKEFIASRDGVEAFVEPPTSVYTMSVCLVAADGEYIRRPVRDERQARSLCKDSGVPLYDARIVGYPRRMREYERGVRQQGIGLDELPPLETTDDDGVD